MTEPAEEMEKNEKPAAEAPVSAEAEADALKAEVAALKDKMLRAVAETDNIRKRAQRDVEESTKYANTAIARDLVNVAENLKRALDSIPESQGTVRQGVEMTLKELLAAFEKHGIRRIDPLGQKFDHNFHQAVAQIESPEAAGTVVQVMQAGYVIRDRLLRPAMVAVAKSAGEAPKQVDTTA